MPLAVSIHAFRGEGDTAARRNEKSERGFNPRLPGGRRRKPVRVALLRHCFNPRLPGGRRQRSVPLVLYGPVFQSTPSGGKATRLAPPVRASLEVSIHAFRGEGDLTFWSVIDPPAGFNPRLPGGRRHPLRLHPIPLSGFNPRLPGGRRRIAKQRLRLDVVSIHAFRGEGDRRRRCGRCRAVRFNPRLPGGRRLAVRGCPLLGAVVSIHAFRGEGDAASPVTSALLEVSIHAFRGEGDLRAPPSPRRSRRSFNPRLPGGRRRPVPEHCCDPLRVSIHAFRGEGDSFASATTTSRRRFNPRLPGGRRRQFYYPGSNRVVVSIHAFRGEGDSVFGLYSQPRAGFNPRLPGGRRRTRHRRL